MAETIQVSAATAAEGPTLVALLDEGALWMIARGIEQWRPGMFPLAMIERRIAQGEVFMARSGGEVVGSFALHHDDPIVWGDGPPVAFYLHNLVVRRRSSGRGIGRELLAWAERDTAARGRPLLRLDCVASNATLRAYYAGAGFTERGDVTAYGLTLRRWEKAVAGPAIHQR
jgi:protein-tyrosine phosphatase